MVLKYQEKELALHRGSEPQMAAASQDLKAWLWFAASRAQYLEEKVRWDRVIGKINKLHILSISMSLS